MNTPEEETQKPFSIREELMKLQQTMPENFVDNSQRVQAALAEKGYGHMEFDPVMAPTMSDEEIEVTANTLIEAFKKLEGYASDKNPE